MFNPLYLTASRHNVYYLRFPIPLDLHPERSQSHVKLSLGTRCPKEALHLARGLCYVGEHILSHMKAASMDYYAIRQFLTQFFKERLETMRQRIALQGPLPPLDIAALENSRSFAKKALEEKDYYFTGSDRQMDELIEEYDLSISKPGEAYELLRTEFLKAFHVYCQKALDINKDFDSYDFDEATLPVVSPLKKSRSLASAIEDYKKEKIRLKEWRDRSLQDYQGKFDLLLRYLGDDRQLALPLEVAISVKDMLLRLPTRINTLPELKDKSLAELMELEGYPRLSPVTVNKHIQAYSGFYDWLVKRKEVKENHFHGLLDKVKKTRNKRKGFEQGDIERILGIVKDTNNEAHKWGTLLALYSGARLNEIAQLDAADIAEVDGVWCIRITDEGGDRKQLKTESSKRDIPIHSQLIAMGFLDYVKSQKKRLFPKLTYHLKDGYGRNLGRWFNESLLRKQLEITDPALVFHSIRHTVATRLRNAKVEEATVKDILGHAHSDVTHAVYAKTLDKRVMRQAIETLIYS